MVIIDTSVAYKFFDPEEDGYKLALNLLQGHLSGNQTITIPDLLLYELANAWATKTKAQSSKIKDNLSDFKEYKFKVEQVNFDLIADAIELSRKYKISVYDACYAVLAEKNGCDLVTADDKFADKVKLSFVKKLSDYE